MTWRDSTLRQADLLVIIALVIFWYGLLPAAGAAISRYSWMMFRRRFGDLLLRSPLNYEIYRGSGEEEIRCRFTGGFESLTGDRVLWLRNDELTVPVALAGAQIYVLPATGLQSPPPAAGDNYFETFDPGGDPPERIRWNRISALTGGTKVFVGGSLTLRDKRRIFVSTRENPLLVIFYDGPDRNFPVRTIRDGRRRNEYWNSITPYSLILGGFFQFMIALTFLPRPAFLLTALTAFIALFTPLFPLIPPGLLFTVLYRRLWWRARLCRALRDLARLPLKYIPRGERTALIPGGELYGALYLNTLPPAFFERKIPWLIPRREGRRKEGWYVFGVLNPAQAAAASLTSAGAEPVSWSGEPPAEPKDPFALYGAIPGNPETLAARYSYQAYLTEIVGWVVLLAGIGLNVFFIQMIVSLLF